MHTPYFKNAFSTFHTDNQQLASTLDHIMQRGIHYADLYFQELDHESWSLENSLVRPTGFRQSKGVGMRAVHGEKTAFSYSNDLSPRALHSAAGVVRDITRQGQAKTIGIQCAAAANSLQVYNPVDPIRSIDEEQKLQLLYKIDQKARARDPRVISVNASLTATREVILVARFDGHLASDVRPLVKLAINVVVEQGARKEQGFSGGGSRRDYRMFDELTIDQWVDDAVSQALNNLEARPAPAGVYDVVLAHGSPGILLHEAIGHGLEGDFNRKGNSAFSDLMGQRVAAPGVTIVDNGMLPNRSGSLTFDDEGTPTQCTTLIEDGILKRYLQDSLNARLMGECSTGNARRAGYSAPPLPRMTNTYMLSGMYDKDEIIRSIKKGVYAVNFGGGQVDISSGKYTFTTTQAWWVENGRIVHPLKNTTLIGHGPRALLDVTMIGNDLALDDGTAMCGKEGQMIPVGVGQPTLRINNMTVGGAL